MASDALVTIDLVRCYGEKRALDGVSIRVPAGAVYGLLGPNGAGKTTLIRCVLGLIRSEAGEVSVFGQADDVLRREGVGAMVETPAFHLFMSGAENLHLAWSYGAHEGGTTVEEALERVGLADRGDDPVKTYSLGMRQRLGLARALLGQPKLLVLDEPTNGLDPRGMKEVRDLLKALAEEGCTIFLSSHLLAEVSEICTHVGVVLEGSLVSEGPLPDDLEQHYLDMTKGGLS